MPGLLDTLLGNPDQTQALGLLGIGLAQGQGVGAFQAPMGLLAGAPGRALEAKIKQAQYDNYMSEIEARKLATIKDQRAQENDDIFYGRKPAPGAMSPGAFAPSLGGMGPTMPQSEAPQGGGGGFTAQQIAQQYGLPLEAVMADKMFNGGKKISELIDSRAKPNWQNINGNLVNTNAQGFQGGLQAGVSAGSGGQVTAWQPDGSGGLVVGAPRGALDTFNAYQNAGEAAKARRDPFTIPAQKDNPNPTLTTREAFTQSLQPQGPASAPSLPQITPQRQSQLDADRLPILTQEMAKARERLATSLQSGDSAAANRALTDMASLKKEMGRLPAEAAAAPAQGVAQQAPAGGIALQSDAQKTAAVKQAEADVQPREQRQNAIASAGYMSQVLDMALKHPGLSTATGLQGTIDPRNYVPGTDATNFKTVLDQIKGSAFLQAFANLKGGGQITEVEGKKATDAIARLNTAQSTPEFSKALAELKGVVDAGQERMKAAYPGGKEVAADATKPAPQTFSQLPPAGQYNGKTATNPSTGQRMRSNGITWVEVK